MKEIDIKELNINPMKVISEEWMLITAGNEKDGYNTMTASWGHMGSLWASKNGLPTAIIYIRPQRYTKEFVDREDYYTLSFFDKSYKKELGYLGSHSGRDEDKVKKVGLTPIFNEKYTYFEEAKLVLVCRKLYRAPIKEEYFIDKDIINEMYPNKDFHDVYVGEIVKALERD